MSMPKIRIAASTDAEAIRAIYAPYIATSITFEESVPSLEAFQKRTDKALATYPYLVAELDGEIVGYAYAHELREREAYQWNAELSVYLAPKAQGHGLGRVLYQALIDACSTCGIKVVFGIVTSPNEPSARLHDALGFDVMCRQRNAGYTCGQWRDVTWYVKYLTEAFENEPQAPTPFPTLVATNPQAVAQILAKANDSVH